MQVKLKNYKPLFYACLTTLVIIFLVQLLQTNESFTNDIYPHYYNLFYPVYASVLGWVPISIGDILYAILVILLIWTLTLGIRCFFLGQKWRGIYIVSRIVLWIGIFYFIFHLLWGFNYYKPSLSEIYNGDDYQIEELKKIAYDLHAKSIKYRNEVGEDENGVFAYHRNEFNKAKPKRLKSEDLIYSQIPQKSRIKLSLFSWAMRYFGVSGYYNPFSGEAQITRKIPTTSIPFSMAHEQAHQMGYATENEANFVGYLTCDQSNDAALQYSANFKALKYILREIYPVDSTFVKDKLANFSDGIKRDYEAEKQFYRKYSGSADKLFSNMNHYYLKANNQQKGIQSYNRFVELLVGYYRKENAIKESIQD